MKTQHDYWQEDHDRTMAEMKLDPLYGAVPPGAHAPFRNSMVHAPSNTITCLAGGEEMLRVSPDGFWVRGEKVAQDDREAETVYNAFKAWMTWAKLNKDYQ